MYKHGVGVREVPTKLPFANETQGGIAIVFGTAPVHLTKNPNEAVNKLNLCRSFDEAKEKLGYSDEYDKYTLCQAMDAFFKVAKVSPVVFCNVLDPAEHNETYNETLQLNGKQLISTKKGVIKEGLTVGSLRSEDYTLNYNEEGFLVVTVTGDTSSLTGGVALSGKYADPSKVKNTHIIGSHNSETGKDTGLELLKETFFKFGEFPSLVVAPGWSHDPMVGVVMEAKCRENGGLFSCECVVDIDTKKAKKVADVSKVKKESLFGSSRMICTYPMIKVGGKKMYMSAMYAATAMQIDAESNGAPNITPSNKPINIEATVLDDGTEMILNLSSANELNANGVVTAINMRGFKFWGNNTAGYPAVEDPKDRWIGSRRFFSWWGNNFVVNYLSKVDNLTNEKLIESIVDAENIRGNSFVAEGKCAGIKIKYCKEDNTIEKLLEGKITFRLYLAPYIPAEHIEAVMEFDVNMLKNVLGGEK